MPPGIGAWPSLLNIGVASGESSALGGTEQGSGVRPAESARDFSWSQAPEPHAERRRALLLAHPEIRGLFGPCPRTKYVCAALFAAQLAAAYLLRASPWWLILLVGYVFGGVVNHALLLAIHELSHNLAFRRPCTIGCLRSS